MNVAGVEVGQNGIQYMAGTFMRNFGGKVLNDALAGKTGTKEALRQSQDAVNALFAQRPKEWEL